VVQYQNKLLKDRFGDSTGKMCYAEYMGFKEPCPFCPMRKAIEHKKTFQIELTGKDGRDYEIVSMPLEREDGSVDALEIIRDVTERKKAEQESFDKQLMLQSVFDASPNALLIIDLNGKILDCNEQAQEIFGYLSKSELVGRSLLLRETCKGQWKTWEKL
jgi:PAS domain-containing protein